MAKPEEDKKSEALKLLQEAFEKDKSDCIMEINETLKKYNCTMRVVQNIEITKNQG